MRKSCYIITCLALSGLLGCIESDEMYVLREPWTETPSENCTTTCDGADLNDVQCVTDTTYRTCQKSDSGCKTWSEPKKCDSTLVCQNGDCVQPPETCTDACVEGSECLNESDYHICQTDDSGCKIWSEPLTCDSGLVCQNGDCVPAGTPCTDTCSEGSKCADNHSYQTCEDTNQDGCKEWSSAKPCPTNYSCENGSCVENQPVCTSQCSAKNAKRCNGKNIETCDDYNKDGCLEWGNPQSCQYACSKGACSRFPECTNDMAICPKAITEWNTWITGNTANSKNVFDNYPSCHDVSNPTTQDESGPEDYYMVNIDEPGFLVVNVQVTNSKTDVDVHILESLDPSSCLARGDISTGAHLQPGVHYISADTYQTSTKAGEYKIRVYFIPDSGKCGMLQKTMERIKGESLQMPIVGPVARESHLVTTEDQLDHNDTNWWPQTIYEGLDAHKARTKKMYGSVISYGDHEGDNKWCSCNDQGRCGSNSTGKAIPPDAEAWDVNMYWAASTKPPKGTRYLVFNPLNGKAVVAAAGYETGPGIIKRMGGAVPEIHNYFGTQNDYALVFGELKNQSYEYGPIDCFSE